MGAIPKTAPARRVERLATVRGILKRCDAARMATGALICSQLNKTDTAHAGP